MNGDLLCLWFMLLTCTFRTISPSPHVCSTHTWLLAFISSSSLWIRFINFRIFTIYKTTNFSCLTAHRTIFLMFLSSGSNGEREHTYVMDKMKTKERKWCALNTHITRFMNNKFTHTHRQHSFLILYIFTIRARSRTSKQRFYSLGSVQHYNVLILL